MTPATSTDVREAVTWLKQSYFEIDDLRWLLRAIERVVDLIDAGEPVPPEQLLYAFRITNSLDPEGDR